ATVPLSTEAVVSRFIGQALATDSESPRAAATARTVFMRGLLGLLGCAGLVRQANQRRDPAAPCLLPLPHSCDAGRSRPAAKCFRAMTRRLAAVRGSAKSRLP